MLKKILFFLIGIITICLIAIKIYNRKAEILYLSNEVIEVGIMPDGGGRVVIFNACDEDNILLSNPELWEIPKPSLAANYVPLMGHIMWVSPQKEWWTQQNLNEDRKLRKADWPPDPFTIYAKYKILKYSKTNLVIKAPVSPITGLEMTKSFNICSNRLTLSATAVNRRDSEVKWGLWSNTRLSAKHRVTIPISSTNDIVGFELGYKSNDIYMPYIITNNTFVYDYRFNERSGITNKYSNKLSIDSPEQKYETVSGNYIFSKTAVTAVNNVHSNHSPIELFIEFDPKNSGFMEQEFHSNYETLQPGEATSFVEVWELKRR